MADKLAYTIPEAAQAVGVHRGAIPFAPIRCGAWVLGREDSAQP